MTTRGPLYGAVEAGGTKFVCAVANAAGEVVASVRLPTESPEATLAAVCRFLRAAGERHGRLEAIGIASFGPVHLDPKSPRYGHIGRTPKSGWTHTDIAGVIKREFGCAVGFDTDVNAAALAEHRWGAGADVENMVYVTVGTGIGGGVLHRGHPIHGLMHPEIGHIWPRRHALDAEFAGVCPFHGDCLEGLAAGPAIVARSGAELAALPEWHSQWHIEADYLGQLCAHLVLTVSPQRIVMGGGVMGQARLFAALRERCIRWLAGYVDRAEILAGASRFIVPPTLAADAGVRGALVLALNAAGG